MSTVKKRTGRDGWQVRYSDDEGRQRTRSFARWRDADAFRKDTDLALLHGAYIDPAAGRVTVEAYARQWLDAQTFDDSTREATALRLRVQIYPTLGRLQLAQVKPSTVQGWLRGLDRLAPSYQRTILRNLSTILSAAVEDGLIAKNPCQARSVKAPRAEGRKVIPWRVDQVLGVREALPARYSIVATLGAGLGLRQGEIFGLAVEDVDFLRGEVHVRRQVKLFNTNGSRQVFALPKGRKTRTVPLPSVVRDELAAFLAVHPAQTVTLPWETLGGEPVSVPLILSTRMMTALNRNYFNTNVWKPALADAGIEPRRENGCHALRHYFASALLDGGESIKAVSEYLGHADAGFTLRVYAHVMPSSAERTRRVIDSALADVRGHQHRGHRGPVIRGLGVGLNLFYRI